VRRPGKQAGHEQRPDDHRCLLTPATHVSRLIFSALPLLVDLSKVVRTSFELLLQLEASSSC
jgi:hypothetical protein